MVAATTERHADSVYRKRFQDAITGVIETLEGRTLLSSTISGGELIVSGSEARNNSISVDLSADRMTYGVKVNAERRTFAASKVKAITIEGGRLNDAITVSKKVYIGAEITPGAGDDTVIGGSGDDQVFETSGNNAIYTQNGNDVVIGGEGNETVYGGYGDDVFFGNGGVDRFYGEFDNDYFEGGEGRNVVYGGPGTDKAVNGGYIRDVESYAGQPGVKAAASATFRLASGVLTVTGSTTSANVFSLSTNSAKTSISILAGTASQSYAVGSISYIKFIGGTGNDLLKTSSLVTKPLSVDFGAGNDTIYSSSGNDTIAGGAGNDRISGGSGNDLISGGTEHDTIYGDAGDDSILGEAGNDRLYGGSGRDMLDGGDGTDYIDGGADFDSQRLGETKVNVEGTLTGAITGGSTGSSGGGTTTPTTPTTPTPPPADGGSTPVYTGGGMNGASSAGGTVTGATVATNSSATKPSPRIFALQTTIKAGQTVFVHGTNTILGAGSPITAQYEWDFGDSAGRYNKLKGFNAGHTYDKPGTYTVKLKVTNEARGSAETAITVTVQAAGRAQIFVSAAGSDSNNGTSTGSAVKSWSKAYDLMQGRSDVEVLFRRGDTFNAAETVLIAKTNVMMGAYGSGSDPVIKWAGARVSAHIIRIESNVIGSMVNDLTFDSIWNTPDGNRSGMPFALKVNGTGNTIRGCTFLNVGYAVQTNGIPTGVLIQDCEAPLNWGLRSYLVWGEGSHFVILGNKVVNSANEHTIRMFGASHVLIAYGDYKNPAIYSWEINKNSLNIQKADYVTVYGNKLSNGNQLGPLGGADGTDKPESRLRHVVFESNYVANGWLRITHGAENLMLKNNVIEYNDNTMIQVDGYDNAYRRGVVNLNIIGNTGINTSENGRFLQVGGSSSGISLVNNIYKADNLMIGQRGNAAIHVVNGSLSSFKTISNNVWPSPSVSKWIRDNAEGGTGIVLLGDPNTIANYQNIAEWNARPQVGTDFQQDTPLGARFAPGGVAASSGTVYAGVFNDYWGNARSLSAWSSGAVEV